jgi:hypothetical protein
MTLEGLTMSGNGHGGGTKKSGSQNLADIVNALHPDKIAEKVVIPHRKIRAGYKLTEVQLDDHEEFKKEISKYMQHHWKGWYKGELKEEDAFGHAKEILDAAFERQGGYQHAVGLAREGKLDEVIDALASTLENQAVNRYTSHVTQTDPDDLEAQTDIAAAVMEKYKPFLGKGKKMEDPKYFARNYKNLINVAAQLSASATQFEKYEPKKGHAKAAAGAHGGGH